MADEPKDDAEPAVEQEAEEFAAKMVAERQWPATVTLKHPIDFGSEHIASLVFRRGRLGDIPRGVKPYELPPVDQLLMIASRMCNKPIKALELLEDEDGSEVLELAAGFFMRSHLAGRTR